MKFLEEYGKLHGDAPERCLWKWWEI